MHYNKAPWLPCAVNKNTIMEDGLEGTNVAIFNLERVIEVIKRQGNVKHLRLGLTADIHVFRKAWFGMQCDTCIAKWLLEYVPTKYLIASIWPGTSDVQNDIAINSLDAPLDGIGSQML